MNKSLLLVAAILVLNACQKDTKTDNPSDGIGSVTIGTQTWTNKNLDLVTYRNGDPIPEVTDQVQWANLTTGAWCYYNNDPANGAVYGRLYNWYAVNDPRGLAPAGWHVPSRTEWDNLTTYLGGKFEAGGKLKETGTVHWQSENDGASNSTGFNGLPGGERRPGEFDYINRLGRWWCSTEVIDPLVEPGVAAFFVSVDYISPYIGVGDAYKRTGYAIRCIKD